MPIYLDNKRILSNRRFYKTNSLSKASIVTLAHYRVAKYIRIDIVLTDEYFTI